MKRVLPIFFKRQHSALLLLLLGLSPFFSGCATISDNIKSAGSYLGGSIGIVPDKTSYSPKEQDKNATALISTEQEYHIGRAVAARILERFKPAENSEQQRYLELLGEALVLAGGAEDTFGGYHFMVIESPQINALAAPGGYVFVTTGFLKQLKDEGELASVLAHEIAHVSKRHGIRILQRSGELDQLNLEGLSAGGLNCADALIQATVLFSRLVDSLVDTLLESGYSQDLEFEADAYGLEILVKTGYSPQSAVSTLEILKGLTRNGSGGWFSTHPSADQRLAQMAGRAFGSMGPDNSEGQAVRLMRFRRALGAH